MLLRNLFVLQRNNCLLTGHTVKTGTVSDRLLNEAINSKNVPNSEHSPFLLLLPLLQWTTCMWSVCCLDPSYAVMPQRSDQPGGLEQSILVCQPLMLI